MDYTVDFSNAMNPAPYTAQTTMGMPAIYELFRNLGMRHLTVINLDNDVMGMITRHEIAALEPHLQALIKRTLTLYKKTPVMEAKDFENGQDKMTENVASADDAFEVEEQQHLRTRRRANARRSDAVPYQELS